MRSASGRSGRTQPRRRFLVLAICCASVIVVMMHISIADVAPSVVVDAFA